jgi:hypothetical protein
MDDELSAFQLIGLLAPIALIQLGLMAFALYDLVRRERVRGGNKWAWGILVIFVNLIGPILYLLLGREED